MERYRTGAREELVKAARAEERTLFVSTLGERLDPDWLTQKVRGYVAAAELGKSGSCHLFRHTMATLMLENGADIRHIQEMLGHRNLETTQVYTQVSLRKLKAIHSRRTLERIWLHGTRSETRSRDGSDGVGDRIWVGHAG